MAKIKPFCATRYNEKRFPLPLVAPPYDIISEEARQKMAVTDYHFIHLDKPGDKGDDKRYLNAAKRLNQWKEEEVLIRDEKPSFYVYEQEFKHPETGELIVRTGFFSLLKLEEPYVGYVYPHEKTLSAPKADRLNLMCATQANLSPVFGLYDDEENKIESIFDKVKKEKKIYDDYIDFDGTKHSIWKIDNENDIAEITNILDGRNMIIADGHHRYATALNYAKEKGSDLSGNNSCDYVMVDLINFNDAGLVILPTHRLINFKLNKTELLEKLSTYFDVNEVAQEAIEAKMLNKRADEKMMAISFAQNNSSYTLTLKGIDVLDGIVPESESKEWRTLEVTLLYHIILKNILNLSESEFQTKITYTHSFAETYSALNTGKVEAALLVPACTKDELEKVTEAQEVMPQKSTYFFPKIFSGFVIYEH